MYTSEFVWWSFLPKFHCRGRSLSSHLASLQVHQKFFSLKGKRIRWNESMISSKKRIRAQFWAHSFNDVCFVSTMCYLLFLRIVEAGLRPSGRFAEGGDRFGRLEMNWSLDTFVDHMHPGKTNMEPENGLLEEEIPFGHHFQVPCYSSRVQMHTPLTILGGFWMKGGKSR